MRHVVVGAGGVGGLLAAALARSGEEVALLVRPGTAGSYPERFRVESAVLGTFEVAVPVVERPGEPADLLWIAVKATQLEAILAEPPEARAVIPLLNGIDHVARLREVYGERVIPGAIRVESERMEPGHIVQPGPFVAVDLVPPQALRPVAEQAAAVLEEAGIASSVQDDEVDVLWRKLALLAPLALATSSLDAPIGAVRQDPEHRELLLGAAREVAAVADAEGAAIDPDHAAQALLAIPDAMRSSMQKDVAAGKSPELDAIGGAVVRHGRLHAIPTPATEELMRRVEARLRAARPRGTGPRATGRRATGPRD
jgi:2-dehydropantoate 2-reductase